jgi:YVTN family beta-propeller protein
MESRTFTRLVSSVAPVGCLVLCSLFLLGSADSAPAVSKTPLRRPIALVAADEGKWLFTANRQSGTVSVIDAASERTVGEVAVGRKIADLAATPDGTHLLAVDEDAGELIVLRRRGSELEAVHRLKVSPTPVSVQVNSDGSRCAVASLWTRQLTLVALTPEPHIVKTIDLPFSPRRQLLVQNTRLLVADAFGGRLAVVDVDHGEVESVRKLPAHNIRGLALSADGKRLLITHQALNPLGRADFDDIHWGNLLSNNLRALPLAAVLDPRADPQRDGDLIYLGKADHGTGDPAGLTIAGDKLLVTLAGVHEVAIGREQGDTWDYVSVGQGPTALLPSRDGQRVYVANTFADSISVVDLKAGKAGTEISLGSLAQAQPADRGEMLFHDARLAHDGWMSCHSCHTDGHTSGRLADTLSDGTYGTPKRILSLRGVADTGPWAWNGSMADLETQVRSSITRTMQGKKPTKEQVRDLVAYLKTLPPPPSRARLLGRVDEAAVRRGHEVFEKHACGSCHTPPVYTSSKTYDVGLADEAGHRHFNPPSLRGISQGGPFFHDGRAATLEDVFTKHRHQLKGALSRQERDDLLSFLGTL